MATAKKAPAKKASVKKAAPAKKSIVKRTVPIISGKSAPKKAVPAAPPAWSTIHIFGYGESQVIGHKANGKVPNGELKALSALFSALAKKQQKGTRISLDDTHALNIFNGSFVDFRPRGAKNMGQRFAWADVDAKAINKLADELIRKAPKEKAGGNFMARLMGNRKPVAAKRVVPIISGKVAPKAKKSVSKTK